MSLRDALFNAGVVNKKDVKKANRDLKKKRKKKQAHREKKKVVEAREQQQRDGRPRGTRKHVRRRRARRRPHRSPRPPARAILTRRPSPRPMKSGSHDRLRDLRNRAGSAVCAAAVPRTPPRASPSIEDLSAQKPRVINLHSLLNLK